MRILCVCLFLAIGCGSGHGGVGSGAAAGSPAGGKSTSPAAGTPSPSPAAGTTPAGGAPGGGAPGAPGTSGARLVGTDAQLPACNASADGALFYVTADSQFKACESGTWTVINLAGAAGPAGPAGPGGSHLVKANGTSIGEWIGGYVQLSTGYYFSLADASDGTSTSAQVASDSLYYTSSDCSGTAYASNNVYAGDVFVGNASVNTPSLFYIPLSASYSETQALSRRDSATPSIIATITLSGTPASGTYVLSFNGASTPAINFNDTSAQIQAKIAAGLPGLIASSVWEVSASYLQISYQTAPSNYSQQLSVGSNTLKTSGSVTITSTVTTSGNTPPGTCITLPATGGSGVLNAPMTQVKANDSTVTGLSVMSFSQPITID